MSLIVVDVESDGPIPPLYSMVCFGAVIVESPLTKTFYSKVKPISDHWLPDALKISGFTREEQTAFSEEPGDVMNTFAEWITKNSVGRPVFCSDNVAYDWQFINYYFHAYIGRNPFGWSGRRIGDLYCGMKNDMWASWKHLRTTKHTHNPVDDAMGNAEALLKMFDLGLKGPH